MTTIGNRQNLTDEEAKNAVEIFNANGRLDVASTNAANNEIFHTNNDVTTVISGSVVKSVSATATKQAAKRLTILAGRK